MGERSTRARVMTMTLAFAALAAAEPPKITSASIAEATEQIAGRRAHMTSDMRLLAGAAFAGPAVTLRLVRDDKASAADAGLAAIKLIEGAPAGSVVDGAVRDIVDLRRLVFPAIARGTAQGSAGGHYRVDGTNVAAQCGGIEVRPGDLVVGDDDGVVSRRGNTKNRSSRRRRSGSATKTRRCRSSSGTVRT